MHSEFNKVIMEAYKSMYLTEDIKYISLALDYTEDVLDFVKQLDKNNLKKEFGIYMSNMIPIKINDVDDEYDEYIMLFSTSAIPTNIITNLKNKKLTEPEIKKIVGNNIKYIIFVDDEAYEVDDFVNGLARILRSFGIKIYHNNFGSDTEVYLLYKGDGNMTAKKAKELVGIDEQLTEDVTPSVISVLRQAGFKKDSSEDQGAVFRTWMKHSTITGKELINHALKALNDAGLNFAKMKHFNEISNANYNISTGDGSSMNEIVVTRYKKHPLAKLARAGIDTYDLQD